VQVLEERRKMLAKNLNTFLDKITATEETVAPVSLEDLIAEGESDELEFKSTLRWDVREGTINKKLEEVIMKTVAAFANSHGGMLLIGVGDDGEVLGLEPDYHSLGGVDRDKFELHLRNLLNQQFNAAFVTSKVVIKFHEVEEKEVCQIVAAPAKDPVILKVKDKNGQITEKFYARSGNSSQEIPLSDVSAYIKERFHS
jgi:predicted HTH transcriptional regulator